MIGLIHAANHYDPNRGASFKTFAFTAIRGAILDEIRKHDPVPRSRRDRLRRMDRASAYLCTDLGRPPTLEELAEYMELFEFAYAREPAYFEALRFAMEAVLMMWPSFCASRRGVKTRMP